MTHKLTDKLWKYLTTIDHRSQYKPDMDTLITDFMREHDGELVKKLTGGEYAFHKKYDDLWGIEKRREQASWLKQRICYQDSEKEHIRLLSLIDTAFGLTEKPAPSEEDRAKSESEYFWGIIHDLKARVLQIEATTVALGFDAFNNLKARVEVLEKSCITDVAFKKGMDCTCRTSVCCPIHHDGS